MLLYSGTSLHSEHCTTQSTTLTTLANNRHFPPPPCIISSRVMCVIVRLWPLDKGHAQSGKSQSTAVGSRLQRTGSGISKMHTVCGCMRTVYEQ